MKALIQRITVSWKGNEVTIEGSREDLIDIVQLIYHTNKEG